MQQLLRLLGVHGKGLLRPATGYELLGVPHAVASSLEPSPLTSLLVVVWTPGNLEVCNAWAWRLQGLEAKLLKSTLSLQLELPRGADASLAHHVGVAKARAHALVLRLLAGTRASVALLDCDVTFFKKGAVLSLLRACPRSVCFLREGICSERGRACPLPNAWDLRGGFASVNSGFILIPDASQPAALQLLANVSSELVRVVSRLPQRAWAKVLPNTDQTVHNRILDAWPTAEADFGILPALFATRGCLDIPGYLSRKALVGHAVQVSTNARKIDCVAAMHEWLLTGLLNDCRWAWDMPERWRRGWECLAVCPKGDFGTYCTCRGRPEGLPRNCTRHIEALTR